MTQNMYLVSVSQPQLGARLVNGVVAAIVNASSATKAKENASLAANANFAVVSGESEASSQGTDLFSATYFDTAVKISADAGQPASGNGTANGDAWIFPDRDVPTYVDHTAYTPIV